ncbi:MAG TPA: malto-oligosyltrehalose trehalohydrolase [Gammaproteobacteria bacterium]|nr:malto-oligosyltrehalose trehalohydrolase [Gammaproteobacteria bacterium]
MGAETDGRRTRFRLWAPSVAEVALQLGDARVAVPMQASGGGWFELETDSAPPGTPYRFLLPDGLAVPDPASRAQQQDAHGPSLVVDSGAYRWAHPEWRGRPWEEAVIYELHVGTFSATGDFDGVRRRLDELAELGVTAVELLPVADFPGRWNWGYDGVLLFAPDRAYGSPEDLKRLIDAAHGRGLMMLLDVVYNHFGPDGNYLHVYAREFFTADAQTPWGAAIDFRRAEVREFFIENALYWLDEYRFDGLRFDAVHAIDERWRSGFLAELGARVREAITGRHVHLVLENDANEAHWLRGEFAAQWNDDIHHAAHVVLTGESGGYYEDYQGDVVAVFGRALAEGFVYQGEPSRHRGGRPRGEPAAGLPPTAFVSFLQNHDQVGNRAFGERIGRLAAPDALQAVTAVLLLAPQVPMLFMGEESLAESPFLYFCDFDEELASAVRAGRRREFASFPAFASEAARARIPDPAAAATVEASRLGADPSVAGRRFRDFVTRLLTLRRERIVPLLAGAPGGPAEWHRWDARGLSVTWTLADGARLSLAANLGDAPGTLPAMPDGERLFAWPEPGTPDGCVMPAWSAAWWLHEETA